MHRPALRDGRHDDRMRQSRMTEFTTLDLAPALARAAGTLGFETLTDVQAQALPPILAGRDVIAQAMTGSGKTAAFGFGLLQKVDPALVRIQALVLCPTRELADQVSKDLRRFAAFLPNIKLLTLCGGIPLRPQLASLAHPPHVVVGTPGRILELLDKDALELDGVRVAVLDEADRMLDMGFEDDIRAILKRAPKDRQTLLFSATYPDEIRALSRGFQRDPLEVTVQTTLGEDALEQWFHEVPADRRFEALATLLARETAESAVVFCNTRKDTQDVADQLWKRGFSALALHGDLEQRERDEVLVRFSNRSCRVLVATDVAARGLDIKDLPLVVSYELPTDPDVHVHRIGRTARAGGKGKVLNLVAPAEVARTAAIEVRQQAPVRWAGLALKAGARAEQPAPWTTLAVDAGRTDKLRPGDLLGALTGTAGLPKEAVGKIDVFATRTYVALRREDADRALEKLRAGGIKGRKFRVRKIG
jgi:ATP-independent RNA helicase DbpA